MESEELTIVETALRLGISLDAVRKRIIRGQIPARKIAGRWRVVLSGPDKGLDREPDKQDRPDTEPDVVLGQQDKTDGQTGQETGQPDKEPDRTGQAKRSIVHRRITSQAEEIAFLRSQLEAREEEKRSELAARDERHQAEVSFIRSQLEERAEEIRRRDVIIQTLAQRLPQLPAPIEEATAQRPANGATSAQGRRWWQVWRR